MTLAEQLLYEREEGRREGVLQGKVEGIEEGHKEGVREGRLETTVDDISRLTARMNLSIAQAMDVLDVSPDMRDEVLLRMSKL